MQNDPTEFRPTATGWPHPLSKRLAPKKSQDFFCGTRHVARSQSNHQIPRSRCLGNGLDTLFHTSSVMRRAMTIRLKLFEHGASAQTFNRLLGSCIDIQKIDFVRLVKSCPEFLEQMLGARKAVWLEENQNSIESSQTCGCQCGFDLRRVMAVVIHHRHSTFYAAHRETSIHSLESSKTLTNLLDADFHLEPHSHSRRCVQDVV